MCKISMGNLEFEEDEDGFVDVFHKGNKIGCISQEFGTIGVLLEKLHMEENGALYRWLYLRDI